MMRAFAATMHIVIAAQAGIQFEPARPIKGKLDSRLRGNDATQTRFSG